MIYTFYSFKGGVGRSMALANVAELLYNLGLKVLLIDFDLEAPGLERYFNSREAVVSPDEIEEKRGLIDLLVSYNTLRQLLQPAPMDPEAFHLDLSFKQPVRNEAGWLNRFAESDVSPELSSVDDAAEQSFPVEPLRSFIQPVYRQNSLGGELFLLPRDSAQRVLVHSSILKGSVSVSEMAMSSLIMPSGCALFPGMISTPNGKASVSSSGSEKKRRSLRTWSLSTVARARLR